MQCCGHLVHPVLMGPARDAPGGPHTLEADTEGGMHAGPCEQRKVPTGLTLAGRVKANPRPQSIQRE